MKKKKLTILQIAESVSKGVMPEGYEIGFIRMEPGVLFDDVVSGKDVKIDRDGVPVPERVEVRGECVVDLDYYRYIIWEGKDEIVEFGPVVLRTVCNTSLLRFVYVPEDREKIERWMTSYDDVMKKVDMKKADMVFGFSYEVGDVKRMFKDVLLKEVIWPDGGGEIKADMICDFFRSDI
jgi:hypothetical protein